MALQRSLQARRTLGTAAPAAEERTSAPMSRPQDNRLPYMPGIDALRAIAVLAVFLYHAGVGWMPGGFLGVDVFFVISGYLITSLLLSEFRRAGRVSLWKFWLRRARRLLPAVGVLIAVTMVVAAIVVPEQMPQLRGDAISSLGYFANWHFIFAHQSYFEQFQRPSLFRHLWSLSVEEQFYLFWPLVFAAGMSLFGRRRLLVGVLAGALASVALAWILFQPGTEVSRVYYGTDTHAVGLLAGVALAMVWSPLGLRRGTPGRWAGPLLDVVGVVAIAFVVLSFLRVHDYDLALYHGGYLWLALFTALLVAVLAHPAARLGGLLAQPPAVWLGLRSYSFYLWHWPVLVLTRPGIDVSMPKGVLVPLQLAAVLALSDLSYRFVERPFASGGRLPKLPRGWGRLTRPVLAGAVLAVVVVIGWSGIVSTNGGHLAPGAAAASTRSSAVVKVSYRSHAKPKGAGQAKGAGAATGPARRQPRGPGQASADHRDRRLGDDRRPRSARRAARLSLLDERPPGPAGEGLRQARPQASRPPPPSRRPGDPDGQQRPPLLRRHGRLPPLQPRSRRPPPADQRRGAGELGGGVQRRPARGGEAVAPHESGQLARDRRAQRLHLGRHPPDPEGRPRLRPPGRPRGAGGGRPQEGGRGRGPPPES